VPLNSEIFLSKYTTLRILIRAVGTRVHSSTLPFQLAVSMLFVFARATHLSGQNWQTAFQINFVADLLNNFRVYEDVVSTARSNVIFICFSINEIKKMA
jgi:hypothetical protein